MHCTRINNIARPAFLRSFRSFFNAKRVGFWGGGWAGGVPPSRPYPGAAPLIVPPPPPPPPPPPFPNSWIRPCKGERYSLWIYKTWIAFQPDLVRIIIQAGSYLESVRPCGCSCLSLFVDLHECYYGWPHNMIFVRPYHNCVKM